MFTSIGETYGGKSGLRRHLEARALALFGFYSEFENIEFTRVRRLVFVCKGNICRSAYAAFRAEALGLSAVSAGLETVDGRPADKNAEKIASERGLDLSTHRTRTIDSLRLENGDLLIAFEPWQARALRKIRPETGPQIALLGLLLPSRMPHIEDPYGLSLGYFRTCFARIDRALESLAKNIEASA